MVEVKSLRRTGLLAGLMFVTFALGAVPASAAPNWTCRASAAQVLLAGTNLLEPLIANPEPGECRDSTPAGLSEITTEPLLPLTTKDAFAQTVIDGGPDPAVQTVAAFSGVTNLVLGAGAVPLLTADVIQTITIANCLGTTPAYRSGGQVVNLRLNGQLISLDELVEQVADGLSTALGAIVNIDVNEQFFSNEPPDETLTRDGLNVGVLPAAGALGLLRAIIARSQVGRVGAVCAQRTPPPLICPAGSVYDQRLTTCLQIIVVPGTGDPRRPCPDDAFLREDGVCIRGNPVPGRPADGSGTGGGPTGPGTLVPVGQISTRRLGPCRDRRFGPLAFIGTNRSDKITGTNRNDRILTGGGNDKVSGGRLNDCIRGETGKDEIDGSNGNDILLGDSGNDRITGGLGNDRLDGGAGRDFLLGGPGANRINGGSGNDFITNSSGKDVVNAGTGNDQINAAKAGGPTKINCGPGRDTVRVNSNELRFLRSCERVFVVRLKSDRR